MNIAEKAFHCRRCCHAQVHGLAAHLGVTPMVDKEDK